MRRREGIGEQGNEWGEGLNRLVTWDSLEVSPSVELYVGGCGTPPLWFLFIPDQLNRDWLRIRTFPSFPSPQHQVIPFGNVLEGMIFLFEKQRPDHKPNRSTHKPPGELTCKAGMGKLS